jgi:hypothetical protein
MTKRIQWRLHLPGLGLILLMLGLLALGGPWPEAVADGFDTQGHPAHWRWLPATPGAALVLWLVSFGVDGLWGLFERNRRLFNPLSLVDEGLIAGMLVRVAEAGVAMGMAPGFQVAAWTAGAVAIGGAFALERYRVSAGASPPQPDARQAQDATDLASNLLRLQAAGQRWSYWSVQTLAYGGLATILGAGCIIGAVAIPDAPVMARALLGAGGVLAFLVGGGFRTVVTPHHLVLRAGHFGPALLRLAMSDIAEVVVRDFDPARDFGGLGIRRGFFRDLAGVWAFNLAPNVGSTGVLVRTNKGKRYLVGTSEPERLAAALNAARAGRDSSGSPSPKGTP